MIIETVDECGNTVQPNLKAWNEAIQYFKDLKKLSKLNCVNKQKFSETETKMFTFKAYFY